MKHLGPIVRDFLDRPGAPLEELLDDLVAHLRSRQPHRPIEDEDVRSAADPAAAPDDLPEDPDP